VCGSSEEEEEKKKFLAVLHTTFFLKPLKVSNFKPIRGTTHHHRTSGRIDRGTEVSSAILKTSADVWFEVFTAVTMKNAVFWDVAPCGSCVNRRVRGTYRLRLQG
jgi:hypothetical protein